MIMRLVMLLLQAWSARAFVQIARQVGQLRPSLARQTRQTVSAAMDANVVKTLFIYGRLPDDASSTKELADAANAPFTAISDLGIPAPILIGVSLITCLGLTYIPDLIDAQKEGNNGDVSKMKALRAFLTRSPLDYSSEDGFNVFLLVFHGYCFYDCATHDGFRELSPLAFLPNMAAIVATQAFARIRARMRGSDAFKSKEERVFRTDLLGTSRLSNTARTRGKL